MKQVKSLLIAAAFICLAKAGTAQGCNFTWGRWQTAMTSQWGNVEFKVQYSTCNKAGGICGWPKIALLHTMGYYASLDVTLKGVDCENKPVRASFSTGGKYIGGNQEYNEPGNWHYFKTANEVARVEVWMEKDGDKYRMVMDKEKGINKIYKNGSPLLANGKTENEEEKEAQQKRELAEQKKKEEEILKEQKEEEEKTKKETSEKEKQEAEKEETDKMNAAKLRQKQYEDSVRLAEEDRRNRLENAKKKDDVENLQAAAITTSVAGIMMSDNLTIEKIEGRKTYFRAQAYLGGYNIPQVENVSDKGNFQYSSLGSQFTYGAGVALDGWLYKTKIFGFLVQPYINYGIDLGSGSSGSFLSYGGNVRLQFGKGIKLFAEAGYSSRSGTYESDNDAVNNSLGIYTNSNVTTIASFDYTTYRYGGGIIVDAMKEENKNMDLGLKLGVYIDNPKTADWDKKYKTPLLYEMQFIAKGGFFIRGEYSTGYPFSGTALYKIDEHPKGQYWTLHLGKVFNLTRSK